MKNSRQLFIKALVIIIFSIVLASCGTESAFFKTEFYTITPRPVWHSFEYINQLRKDTGSFRYAIFQKSPIEIKQWNEEDRLNYAFVLSSYYDSRIIPGEFKYVESVSINSNIEIIREDFPKICGLKVHWFEAFINISSSSERTYNLIINIPIESGYIEFRAWCPEGNKNLIEEYKNIVDTLYVSDSKYFKNNPQDDPWRIKQ